MKAITNIKVEYSITLQLKEDEARAFDAIIGYGFDEFLKMFKEHLGTHYIKNYENAARSLFEHRQEIANSLSKINKMKEVINS